MSFGIPKHIYIETSAIDPWPISMEVAAFERLARLSKALRIKLLIPDTVIFELQKHHAERCEEKIRALSLALREARNYLKEIPETDFSTLAIGRNEIQEKLSLSFESKGIAIITRP